jgi:hypothetical protein
MNAKKPSNLHFEDFKQWLKELDDHLPYLTFQDLSINIWEMINFLWHSRKMCPCLAEEIHWQ